jgi:bacteriocin leader peptide (microcyclamide/patellamide family)
MNKQNLMPQIVNPINRLTIQDLSSELVELWEEDLKKVIGAGDPPVKPPVRQPKTVKVEPDGTIVVTYPDPPPCSC